MLLGLKGIGREFAGILFAEALSRSFANRRQVAAQVGLRWITLALVILGLSLQFVGLFATLLATVAVILLVAVVMSISPELRRAHALKAGASESK